MRGLEQRVGKEPTPINRHWPLGDFMGYTIVSSTQAPISITKGSGLFLTPLGYRGLHIKRAEPL